MRAAAFMAWGGPEVLRIMELPEPAAGPGEVVVKVAASTVPMNGLTARLAVEALALPPGSTVLVTGGAGAAGGYAIRLSRHAGLRIIADARDSDVELLHRLGAERLAVAGSRVLIADRRLDVLVNNAGISGARAPLEAMSLEAFETAIRVNLTGTFLMCQGAVPRMRRGGWGRIVNMASMVACGQPGTNRCNYTASKAGIIAFSRVLADQVGRDGITVNCVAPSRIATALTRAQAAGNPDYFVAGAAQSAVGRPGEPQDVVHAVAWLCSAGAGFVTGAVLDVNGGTTMP